VNSVFGVNLGPCQNGSAKNSVPSRTALKDRAYRRDVPTFRRRSFGTTIQYPTAPSLTRLEISTRDSSASEVSSQMRSFHGSAHAITPSRDVKTFIVKCGGLPSNLTENPYNLASGSKVTDIWGIGYVLDTSTFYLCP